MVELYEGYQMVGLTFKEKVHEAETGLYGSTNSNPCEEVIGIFHIQKYTSLTP